VPLLQYRTAGVGRGPRGHRSTGRVDRRRVDAERREQPQVGARKQAWFPGSGRRRRQGLGEIRAPISLSPETIELYRTLGNDLEAINVVRAVVLAYARSLRRRPGRRDRVRRSQHPTTPIGLNRTTFSRSSINSPAPRSTDGVGAVGPSARAPSPKPGPHENRCAGTVSTSTEMECQCLNIFSISPRNLPASAPLSPAGRAASARLRAAPDRRRCDGRGHRPQHARGNPEGREVHLRRPAHPGRRAEGGKEGDRRARRASTSWSTAPVPLASIYRHRPRFRTRNGSIV